MSTKESRTRVSLGLILIVLAGATRLLPHEANFTAMGAMALFAGYLFRKPLIGYAMVLASMLLTDLLLGFDSFTMRAVVYGSLLVPVLLGALLSNRVEAHKTTTLLATSTGATLGAGLFFFLSTNMAVWATSGMYTLDFAGLMQSYVNGLPFYRTALAGDLVFTAILFGVYSLSASYLARQELAMQRVSSN